MFTKLLSWYVSLLPSVSTTFMMIENYTCAFELSSHSLVLVTSQNAFRISNHSGSCIHSWSNTIVSCVRYIFNSYNFYILRVQGNNKWLELKVFNLNTWGISWFDDEPNVSSEEPYDISSVADTDINVSILLLILVYNK